MPNEQKTYYEGPELEELISVTDWPKILTALYASTRRMIYKRFLSDPDKGILGRTYKDYVNEAITLFMEGTRKCPKNVELPYFLHLTIRNLISKHIAKHYNTLSSDSTEEEILRTHYESINIKFDIDKVRNHLNIKFQDDEICRNIFDCWAEGIFKPAEIRELFGYSEPDYNNGKKRLDRVLIDIRKHL